MYQKKSGARFFILMLLDLACIYFSIHLGYYLRYKDSKYTRVVLFKSDYYYIVIATSLLMYLLIKVIFGVDKKFFKRNILWEPLIVLRNNILIFSGLTMVLYSLKIGEQYSRLAIYYFLAIDCIAMTIVHLLFRFLVPLLYSKMMKRNRTLVITDTDYADEMLEDIIKNNDFGNEIVGVVFIDDNEIQEYHGLQVVANKQTVVEYCQKGYLDELIVATGKTHRREVIPIMSAISEMGVTIHYHMNVPNLTGAKNKTLTKIGKHYMMTYATRFVSGWELVIKRLMDIVGAFVGCIVLVIVTIIIGPIIKIQSPGPIFFSQKRVGRNGRYFQMYKFRSMYMDAEERKKELMKENEMDGLMFKMENDPRITKIGKFIRKTSIDEFPQFWNVLKGDMSLVGTRPPTIDEFEHYSPYHKKRLSFRPGITGLWQVSGRNDISDFEQVVELDVEYIDNWSPWLDVKILFKTVGALFMGR